jgi:hypothetical protein
VSEPIAYDADNPDGRPATDADLQAVLPPELLNLWQAGALDDE